MSKRIGVLVDVSNLYYCIKKKFRRKLDYQKYVDFVRDLGEPQALVAYGAQLNNEAEPFIRCLKAIGFRTKFKAPKSFDNDSRRKADWDVGIAIDAVAMAPNIDLVVLGSADSDLVPMVEHLRNQGVEVIVFACGISRELREVALECIEIPESLLEEQKNELSAVVDVPDFEDDS